MVDGLNLLLVPQFFRASILPLSCSGLFFFFLFLSFFLPSFFSLRHRRHASRRFQTPYFSAGGRRTRLCPAINSKSVSIVFERTYLGARISFKTPDLIERHKNGYVVRPSLFSAREGVSGCYVKGDRESAKTRSALADPRTFLSA